MTETKIHEMLDITAPVFPVEIQIRHDGKVIWVYVDGQTVLRICRPHSVVIIDHRK